MKRLLLFIALVCSFALPATASAAGWNPFGGACEDSAGGAAVACDSSTNGADPLTGTAGVINKVSTIIAILAGVAAVIIIIIAGLQFITSGGDPQSVATARNAILGAVIGLIIIVAARSIVLFILNRVSK